MNPGRFFREVLESPEFWSSGMVFGGFAHVFQHRPYMSDKANLLDIVGDCRVGRFLHHIVDESAAT